MKSTDIQHAATGPPNPSDPPLSIPRSAGKDMAIQAFVLGGAIGVTIGLVGVIATRVECDRAVKAEMRAAGIGDPGPFPPKGGD